MTIGIYALYWEEQDLIYIGLSERIEGRYRSHISDLVLGTHSNYKVTDAYTKYGKPTLYILETCSISELTSKEVYWTNEFDSLNNKETGLNIITPGSSGGSGVTASSSKYSKLQILITFRIVSSEKYINSNRVSHITGVGKDTVISIIAGKVHQWLKEEYPFRYNLMVNRRDTRRTVSNISEKIIGYTRSIDGLPNIIVESPEGLEYIITNITGFAREHGLNQAHLSKVVNKQRKSHKGWKLKSS